MRYYSLPFLWNRDVNSSTLNLFFQEYSKSFLLKELTIESFATKQIKKYLSKSVGLTHSCFSIALLLDEICLYGPVQLNSLKSSSQKMRSKKLKNGWHKVSLGDTQTDNTATFHISFTFNVIHCHKIVSNNVLIAYYSVYCPNLVFSSVLAP